MTRLFTPASGLTLPPVFAEVNSKPKVRVGSRVLPFRSLDVVPAQVLIR